MNLTAPVPTSALRLGVNCSCLVLVFSGCSSLPPPAVTSYVDPAGLQLDRLAILPQARGDRTLEWGLRDTCAVQLRFLGFSVVSPDTITEALDDANLDETYTQMVQSYAANGKLDGRALLAIGRRFDVGHFLSVREVKWTRKGGPRERIWRRYLEVSWEIWSAQRGDIVWKGSTTARQEVDGYCQYYPGRGDVCYTASDMMVMRGIEFIDLNSSACRRLGLELQALRSEQ